MAVKIPSEYKSLVALVRNEGPGMHLSPQERRRSYWNNTLNIEIPTIVNGQRMISKGSGLLLIRDGYFVTNCHVLSPEREEYVKKNGHEIKVRPASFSDSQFYFKLDELCVFSRNHDLAVGKVSGLTDQSPTEVFFPIEKPQCNNNICVYGYKHEVMEEKRSSISTVGFYKNLRMHNAAKTVGADHFLKDMLDSKEVDKHCFTSEADIEPGWSGGPVVKYETGEFIGVTMATASADDRATELAKKLNVEYLLSASKHVFISYEKVIDLIKIYLNTKRVN